MSLSPGTLVGRYRIVAALGAGGMGEVYRAFDARLKREVALKVLPAELTDDVDRRRRFLTEAQSAAALSHPRIASIYDADEVEGVCYLAMELVAGAPLTDRLRSGPVPAGEALALAADVAEGLVCAHARGIVHRDLKPANVLVGADGHARLIDFGLAKLLEPGSGETITGLATRAGSVAGTPAYMAPEQVRGAVADARADLFSFGLLLYELLTGRRPFDRGSWPETIAAVLRDPVPPLAPGTSGLSGGALASLQGLLDRCLAKEPAERPTSMAEILGQLAVIRRLVEHGRAGAGGATEEASIVVLPFENLSPDPDNAYFADGLTEEVIADLSKVRALRVISRTSAMRFKGTNKSLPEIARALNVRHVLEGSVRRAGNNLRITAQLIDAETDGHLWTERYAGTLDDVFDIQEKVARAITGALQVKLSPDEQRRLAERPVADARVLDCYHRAQHELFRMTGESFERGIGLLQRGIASFGDHAILYEGLAQAHYLAIEAGLEAREEALMKAADCTRHLESFDSRYGHALLGKHEYVTGSPVKGVRHLEDAVAANPGDVDSLFHLAWGYSHHAGKPAAAGAVADRLISIDPLSATNLLARAGAFWADANFAQALGVFDDMLRHEPGLWWVNAFRAHMLGKLGRIADACRAAEQSVVECGVPVQVQAGTALKHALLGEREPLLALMTGELESFYWNDPEAPAWVAGWFALVNERDQALRWLEHWVDRGSINYPMLAHGDPWLKSLRGEPRFQRLLDRIRPEWERFVPRFQAS